MKHIFKLLILLGIFIFCAADYASAETNKTATSDSQISKKIDLKNDAPEKASKTIKATVNNESTDLTDVSRPVPTKKPTTVTVTETKNPSDQETETSLISFAMSPLQVELDENLNSFLKDYALKKFHKKPKSSMIIQSYAESRKDDKYQEARISLARALEIREFLMENGISPKQIEIQAMTGKDNPENTDRIDILFKEAKSVQN